MYHLKKYRHFQNALLYVVHDPHYDNISKDPEELNNFFNKPEKSERVKDQNSDKRP